MGKKKKKNKINSDIYLSDAAFPIYQQLKNLAISTFKYENMPDSVNVRFLEIGLYESNYMIFFEDDELGFLALKGTNQGRLSIYNEPVGIRIVATNGYQKERVNHEDCVLMYQNNLRNSMIFRLTQFANRIANAEITSDINIYAQRTPVVFKSTKETEFSIKNLAKQYDDYEFKSVVDSSLDSDAIGVLQTQAPFVALEIDDYKRRLWNEALSFIGIENNSAEKSERLLLNETIVSNGLAIATRNTRLQAREKAIDEINEMFGLDIKVKNNTISLLDFDSEGNPIFLQENEDMKSEEGGEENE